MVTREKEKPLEDNGLSGSIGPVKGANSYLQWFCRKYINCSRFQVAANSCLLSSQLLNSPSFNHWVWNNNRSVDNISACCCAKQDLTLLAEVDREWLCIYFPAFSVFALYLTDQPKTFVRSELASFSSKRLHGISCKQWSS